MEPHPGKEDDMKKQILILTALTMLAFSTAAFARDHDVVVVAKVGMLPAYGQQYERHERPREIVLFTENGNRVLHVRNAKALRGWEGETVRVFGKIDRDGDSIKVKRVEPLYRFRDRDYGRHDWY